MLSRKCGAWPTPSFIWLRVDRRRIGFRPFSGTIKVRSETDARREGNGPTQASPAPRPFPCTVRHRGFTGSTLLWKTVVWLLPGLLFISEQILTGEGRANAALLDSMR